MTDHIRLAINDLQEKLKREIAGVRKTKEAINNLCSMVDLDPLYPDVSEEEVHGAEVRADLFYGKPLATAAQMFLESKKKALPAEEILSALERGGFDFRVTGWKDPEARLRNLSISLAKNVKKFHRLPNGTFGLLAWYPQVSIDRKSAKAEATEEQENEEEATPKQA